MSTRRPQTLTLPDGTLWPVPQPVNTLSAGTSWRLRYRPAEKLSTTDIIHAAEVIDAYARLCAATPAERDAIIEALRAEQNSEFERVTS